MMSVTYSKYIQSETSDIFGIKSNKNCNSLKDKFWKGPGIISLIRPIISALFLRSSIRFEWWFNIYVTFCETPSDRRFHLSLLLIIWTRSSTNHKMTMDIPTHNT